MLKNFGLGRFQNIAFNAPYFFVCIFFMIFSGWINLSGGSECQLVEIRPLAGVRKRGKYVRIRDDSGDVVKTTGSKISISIT